MRKILMILALILLVGCSNEIENNQEDGGNSSKAVKNPQSAIFEVETSTSSLDPATVFDPTGVNIVIQMYEQLLNYNEETNEVEPWLAKGYSLSEDGLTYTLELREDIKFHDGTDFNAEAVKYNLDRIILMSQPRGMNTFISGLIRGSQAYAESDKTADDVQAYLEVQGVEVVGNYTVNIHLERAYPAFPHILSMQYAGMISPTFVEENGGIIPGEINEYVTTHAIGTGPYELESFDVGSGEARLKAFDNYWGTPLSTGKASIEQVIIRPVDNPLIRSMNLQSGESDMALLTPEEMFQFIEKSAWVEDGVLESKQEGIDVLGPFKLNRIEALLMNKEIKKSGTLAEFQPFQDERIREAFTLVFDQDAYINQVLHGFGQPINGPIPEGWTGYDPTLPIYEVDLDKARKLLEEAAGDNGYSPSNPKVITLNYPAGEEESEASFLMLASAINSMDVGLQLNISPLAYPAFTSALYAGELDMIRVSWVGSLPDPDGNLSAFADGNNGTLAKAASYRNETLMNILSQQATELDEVKREELIKEAVKMMQDEHMYIYRSQRSTFWVQRDWIEGFKHRRATIGPLFYELKKG